jgi:hypothetical protein
MLLWFLACAPLQSESDTDLAPDTDVPNDRTAVWTPVLGGVFTPLDLWLQADGWVANPPACPQAAASGDVTTYSGGCTDDRGLVWTGELVRTDATRGTRLEYRGFGPGVDATLDGELVWFRDGDRLEVDLTERGPGGGLLRAWTSGYQVTSAGGARAAWTRAGRGDGAVSGSLTVGDGLYQVAASIGHDGVCGREPDRGEVTVTGFRAATLTFNGAAICDGCVPVADEYGIADICPFGTSE